jgi:hypothetical protein
LGWVGDEGRVISYGEEEERERRKSMFYFYFIKQILIFQYLISMVFVSVKMSHEISMMFVSVTISLNLNGVC